MDQRRQDFNAKYWTTGRGSMDGHSQPCFRDYRYDFPQDTQLFGGYLPDHHRYNGFDSLFQVKMTFEFILVAQSPANYRRLAGYSRHII
jgi:hypothetical protein